MAGRYVIGLSGFDLGLPFFEESSEKRDRQSWWGHIEKEVLGFGVKVQSVVSDRAKALIGVCDEAGLNVVSFPDLFHYMQDMNQAVGLELGKKEEQVRRSLSNAKEEVKASLQTKYDYLSGLKKLYRREIEGINKLIHPFDCNDIWTNEERIRKGLIECLRTIGKISADAEIEIRVPKASKVYEQISPIAKGVGEWIRQTKTELENWVSKAILSPEEEKCLTGLLLPFTYWEVQLVKTRAKLRNHDLRNYYKQRQADAKKRLWESDFWQGMDESRQRELYLLAHQLAVSFQRSSSQVEGRNGYLSFAHHAQRGLGTQRLKVLTVVHNYDIRRKDGTSPAERFFKKDFPDLFDFLCQNVTGFKEPRKRKDKSLITSIVQS